MLYNSDGQQIVQIVPGTTRTGLYSPDGYYYGVIAPSPVVSFIGAYHPCGALWVTVGTSTTISDYAPDGSLYIYLAPGGYVLGNSSGNVLPRAVNNKFGAIAGNNATGTTGDAGHASATSRVSFRSPATASPRPSYLFTNWRLTPSGETNGANNITIKAALEISGVANPIFFSGSRTKVLAPGESVWSDPMDLTIPASTQGFIRTYVSVVAGQTWCISRAASVSNGEGSNYASSITPGIDDVDNTGVIPGSGTSGYVYSASGCRALPASRSIASVLIVGDSIAVGAGEIAAGTFGDANGYTGFIERGLGSSVHWQTDDRSSDTTANFLAGVKRFSMFSGTSYTHAVCEYGTNDVYGSGLTFAQSCQILTNAWTKLRLYVPKVIQTTITPRTTSSDGWITTVNQTIVGAGTTNTVRTQVNDWLRDNAPLDATTLVPVATGTVGALRAGTVGHPLFKVWDTASLAETALNSGIWNVGGGAWTTDGIHPNVLGNTSIQSSVILADLTV